MIQKRKETNGQNAVPTCPYCFRSRHKMPSNNVLQDQRHANNSKVAINGMISSEQKDRVGTSLHTENFTSTSDEQLPCNL